MKRPEFMYRWQAMRKRFVQSAVDAGTMRVSEAAMTMANVHKEAKALWRKHGKSFAEMQAEDIWPGKTDEERGGPYLPDPRKGSKLMRLLKAENEIKR